MPPFSQSTKNPHVIQHVGRPVLGLSTSPSPINNSRMPCGKGYVCKPIRAAHIPSMKSGSCLTSGDLNSVDSFKTSVKRKLRSLKKCSRNHQFPKTPSKILQPTQSPSISRYFKLLNPFTNGRTNHILYSIIFGVPHYLSVHTILCISRIIGLWQLFAFEHSIEFVSDMGL